MSTETSKRLFTFGLVSDVQHADIADGVSFHGVPRFYRHALQTLRRAVDAFRAEEVDFVMHLGDVRRWRSGGMLTEGWALWTSFVGLWM